MKYDIFLSYRHEGAFPIANHLSERLTRDGYKVSFDKHGMKSGKFDVQLLERIEQSRVFVVLLNKDVFQRTLEGTPIESDWLRRELAHAISLGKKIIPIILPNFTWPDKLPDDINDVRNYQSPTYSRTHYNQFYDEFRAMVNLDEGFLSLTKRRLRRVGFFVRRFYWLLAAILLAFGILGYSYLRPHNMVLLAGGGSVRGFIETENKIDLSEKNKDFIYVPMASRSAYRILHEELSVPSNRAYFPVILSAGKATESEMIDDNEMEEFMQNIGKIVPIYLGDSYLQVTISSDIPDFDKYVLNDFMTTETLSKILKDKSQNNVRLYTTNFTSGTFNKYSQLLSPKGINLDTLFVNGSCNIFYQKFGKKEIFGKKSVNCPFVILETSTYYADIEALTPQQFRESEKKEVSAVKFNVKDNDSVVSNPLYLYVVAYKMGKNGEYIYPREVRNVLKKFNIELPKKSKLNNQYLICPDSTIHTKNSKTQK